MSDSRKAFRILVIDDEESVRSLLRSRFERRGHTVHVATSGQEALTAAKTFDPHVAISDIRMADGDGFLVLENLPIPVLLITGHGDKESAIKAVEAGAFAFFEKPFDMESLEVMVTRAGERRLMEIERADLLAQLDRQVKLQRRELESIDSKTDGKMVGNSPALKKVRGMLEKLAAKKDANVLILGETGTGKEVAARELHQFTWSDHERVPFLAINCAAIPTELLESELFGHEKGSFTGAQGTREGLAEAVQEGTLFLDEIGEMELRLQAKLLRLVQERSFRRIGSNKELPFRGRIVAATHRNLKQQIADKRFREDLYYRLSVVTVDLPALRERSGDIALLAEHLCKKHGLKGLQVERAAEAFTYPWPGNIRELNNWIERASILGEYNEQKLVTAPIPQNDHTLAHAPASRASEAQLPPLPSEGNIKDLREALLDAADKKWIQEALERHNGNISAAARDLGLDRKNLANRMKTLKLAA